MSANSTRIRELNDEFRKTFVRSKVLLTVGVQLLSADALRELIAKIQSFDQFSPDNDPHQEHDFVSIDMSGDRYFAKIDYYDPSMTAGSEDPADPAKTTRVLTIMHSSEY